MPGHEHGRWSSGQAVGWPVTVSWATKKKSSVHLSFHENLVNADEMDGKWKVETGAFFFPSEISQFHSISIQTSTSAHALCFLVLDLHFPSDLPRSQLTDVARACNRFPAISLEYKACFDVFRLGHYAMADYGRFGEEKRNE